MRPRPWPQAGAGALFCAGGAALHGGEAAKRNALINALLRFGEEPAYRIRLLDRPNGTEAAVFTLVINPELLANQLQAESIKIDQSGVTF